MGHSSRVLCCLSLLLTTPAFGQGHPVGLMRAPAIRTAVQTPRLSLHSAARSNVRPSLATRSVRPLIHPRLARANTLGSLQKVGLRNGRIPRIGNGFGLFGVGLGLSTAEDLAALPFPGNNEAPPPDAASPELPRCVRPQIIKIGQGVRRKVKTKVVYGPAMGCTP